MVQITISAGDAGRKLGRYLEKILPGAPKSIFFKALRNNRIKINRKKPKDLSGFLNEGDSLELYLTDDQLKDFGYVPQGKRTTAAPGKTVEKKKIDYKKIPVLYEDDQVLIVHKPVGVLSQKSKPSDISLTEIERAYLVDKGEGSGSTYQPSFVHRLDRNTEGVMIMAKTLAASQILSEMVRTHSLKKYYYAIVKGEPSQWKEPVHLVNAYRKDKSINKAEIRPFSEDLLEKGWQKCELIVRLISSKPLGTQEKCSLLEIQLLTGKSHQIRAQLSAKGFPIMGDGKYDKNEDTFRQKLMAAAVEFCGTSGCLSYMEGKRIETNAEVSRLSEEIMQF